MDNTLTHEGEESLIEFPANLSVKAMGLKTPDFEALVVGLVSDVIAPQTLSNVHVQPSSKDKYVSVRMHFTAEDQSQLERVYAALKSDERVLFTL